MTGKTLSAACSGPVCLLRRKLPPEGQPGQIREALPFIGNGDARDAVTALERAFAVKFTETELNQCATAGDLSALVWRHMQERVTPENARCMTAMAFHALRRVLMTGGTPRGIRLTDRLDSFTWRPRALAQAMETRTGLSIEFAGGSLGRAGRWMQLAWVPLIGGIITARLDAVLVSAAVAVSGILAMRLDPQSFANETVGDLTRRLTANNFGLLIARGARFDEQAVWHTVCFVLAEHSDCQTNEIGPETLLVQQR